MSLNGAHKNPGGTAIFKCSFTEERPESASVSLQMSDNPLLSQTDRSCYFPSSRWDRPQESSYETVLSSAMEEMLNSIQEDFLFPRFCPFRSWGMEE